MNCKLCNKDMYLNEDNSNLYSIDLDYICENCHINCNVSGYEGGECTEVWTDDDENILDL